MKDAYNNIQIRNLVLYGSAVVYGVDIDALSNTISANGIKHTIEEIDWDEERGHVFLIKRA